MSVISSAGKRHLPTCVLKGVDRMTVDIRPIRPGEADAAVALIVSVAQPMFSPNESQADFRARLESRGIFDDVHSHDTIYRPPAGTFLVAVVGDAIIGTGAIRRFDDQTAELRRLWLREAYQGQGIGYRLTKQLLDFATAVGYSAVVLTTETIQTRAIAFYRHVGFTVAAVQGDDVHMRLELTDRPC